MTDIRLQHLIDKMKELFATNIFTARNVHLMKTRVNQFLDLSQSVKFFRCNYGDGDTTSSRSSCSSAPVGIYFGIIRQLIINNMCDPLDIYSSRGHVSGNQ